MLEVFLGSRSGVKSPGVPNPAATEEGHEIGFSEALPPSAGGGEHAALTSDGVASDDLFVAAVLFFIVAIFLGVAIYRHVIRPRNRPASLDVEMQRRGIYYSFGSESSLPRTRASTSATQSSSRSLYQASQKVRSMDPGTLEALVQVETTAERMASTRATSASASLSAEKAVDAPPSGAAMAADADFQAAVASLHRRSYQAAVEKLSSENYSAAPAPLQEKSRAASSGIWDPQLEGAVAVVQSAACRAAVEKRRQSTSSSDAGQPAPAADAIAVEEEMKAAVALVEASAYRAAMEQQQLPVANPPSASDTQTAADEAPAALSRAATQELDAAVRLAHASSERRSSEAALAPKARTSRTSNASAQENEDWLTTTAKAAVSTASSDLKAGAMLVQSATREAAELERRESTVVPSSNHEPEEQAAVAAREELRATVGLVQTAVYQATLQQATAELSRPSLGTVGIAQQEPSTLAADVALPTAAASAPPSGATVELELANAVGLVQAAARQSLQRQSSASSRHSSRGSNIQIQDGAQRKASMPPEDEIAASSLLSAALSNANAKAQRRSLSDPSATPDAMQPPRQPAVDEGLQEAVIKMQASHEAAEDELEAARHLVQAVSEASVPQRGAEEMSADSALSGGDQEMEAAVQMLQAVTYGAAMRTSIQAASPSKEPAEAEVAAVAQQEDVQAVAKLALSIAYRAALRSSIATPQETADGGTPSQSGQPAQQDWNSFATAAAGAVDSREDTDLQASVVLIQAAAHRASRRSTTAASEEAIANANGSNGGAGEAETDTQMDAALDLIVRAASRSTLQRASMEAAAAPDEPVTATDVAKAELQKVAKAALADAYANALQRKSSERVGAAEAGKVRTLAELKDASNGNGESIAQRGNPSRRWSARSEVWDCFNPSLSEASNDSSSSKAEVEGSASQQGRVSSAELVKPALAVADLRKSEVWNAFTDTSEEVNSGEELTAILGLAQAAACKAASMEREVEKRSSQRESSTSSVLRASAQSEQHRTSASAGRSSQGSIHSSKRSSRAVSVEAPQLLEAIEVVEIAAQKAADFEQTSKVIAPSQSKPSQQDKALAASLVRAAFQSVGEQARRRSKQRSTGGRVHFATVPEEHELEDSPSNGTSGSRASQSGSALGRISASSEVSGPALLVPPALVEKEEASANAAEAELKAAVRLAQVLAYRAAIDEHQQQQPGRGKQASMSLRASQEGLQAAVGLVQAAAESATAKAPALQESPALAAADAEVKAAVRFAQAAVYRKMVDTAPPRPRPVLSQMSSTSSVGGANVGVRAKLERSTTDWYLEDGEREDSAKTGNRGQRQSILAESPDPAHDLYDLALGDDIEVEAEDIHDSSPSRRPSLGDWWFPDGRRPSGRTSNTETYRLASPRRKGA